MQILHLSDLHFGTVHDANLWYSQLAEDLVHELGCSRLDALVVSGDIADAAMVEEYAAAEVFLAALSAEFGLLPEQLIIVPGNNDVSHSLAEKAYEPILREEFEEPVDDNHNPTRNHVSEKSELVKLQNASEYRLRFKPFSEFYQRVKGTAYPLEYDRQAIVHHFPAQNLLVLGLNSSWQIDHYHSARASIHANAIGNALAIIHQTPAYANGLKFAVWHHPITGPIEDRITDVGFVQGLAQAGFCLVMHGHTHRVNYSLYCHDDTAGGRLEIVGGGAFGASTRQSVPCYPLQYNLLRVAKDRVFVEMRNALYNHFRSSLIFYPR